MFELRIITGIIRHLEKVFKFYLIQFKYKYVLQKNVSRLISIENVDTGRADGRMQ